MYEFQDTASILQSPGCGEKSKVNGIAAEEQPKWSKGGFTWANQRATFFPAASNIRKTNLHHHPRLRLHRLRHAFAFALVRFQHSNLPLLQ